MDLHQRLSRVQLLEIDGALWWPFQDICDALKITNRRTASKMIDGGHKQNVIIRARTRLMNRRICVIDRTGVEALAIRFSGSQSRADIMAALEGE